MNTQGTAAVDGPGRARAVPSEGSDADRTLNLTLDAVIAGEVATVPLDARLPTALHLMATTGVRHLPVVNRGWCEGLLLEIDLVVRTARAGHPEAALLTAGDLQRPAPQLPPTARVSDAARLMARSGSDAVLVTAGGRVLGVVTATDLVRLIARPDSGR
jgi:CBS domain-containing protein